MSSGTPVCRTGTISSFLEAWRNLDTPLHLDEAAVHGSPPPSTAKEWLVPGRKWRGKIAIPGHIAGSEPVPYRFEIIEGNTKGVIYCIHADEVDAQAAVVHMVGTDAQGRTQLRWQDFETAIEATLDPVTGKLEGQVHQIKEALGEGFWYDSDQQVNCCYLDPLPENPQYHVDLRQQVLGILYSDEYNTGSRGNEEAWFHTSPCSPSEMHAIFEEACLQAQLLQADMREQTMKLRQTTFVTVDEKRRKVCLVGCGEKSVRHRAHMSADNCSSFMQRSLFYMRVPPHMDAQGERCAHPQDELFRAHQNYMLHDSRMRRVYDSLDTALRQFEQRVPEEVLHRYKFSASAVASDATCCICMEREAPEGSLRPDNLGYSGPPRATRTTIGSTVPPRSSPAGARSSGSHKNAADDDNDDAAEESTVILQLGEAIASAPSCGSDAAGLLEVRTPAIAQQDDFRAVDEHGCRIAGPEARRGAGVNTDGDDSPAGSFYTLQELSAETHVLSGDEGNVSMRSSSSCIGIAAAPTVDAAQCTTTAPARTRPHAAAHATDDTAVAAVAADAESADSQAGPSETMGEEESAQPENENEWIILPCSHTFHLRCAWEWFHHSSECPYCRSSLQKLQCSDVASA